MPQVPPATIGQSGANVPPGAGAGAVSISGATVVVVAVVVFIGSEELGVAAA